MTDLTHQRYQALFDNIVQGVFFQNADGTLCDVNPAALEMFGLSREEFLGRSSYNPEWDVINEDGQPLLPNDHPSMVALTSGLPARGNLVGVFNNRRNCYVWMDITAIPLFRDGQSRPFQVVVTLQFMTDGFS